MEKVLNLNCLRIANLKNVNIQSLNELEPSILPTERNLLELPIEKKIDLLKNAQAILRETLNSIINKTGNTEFTNHLFNSTQARIILDNGKPIVSYVVNSETAIDPLELLLIKIAEELFTLFYANQLPYLRQCPARDCNNYFLAERIDGVYCSKRCKRKVDYDKNAKEYKIVLKDRRSSGVYKPKLLVRCKVCNHGVKLPRDSQNNIDTTERMLICNNCKTPNENPYFES